MVRNHDGNKIKSQGWTHHLFLLGRFGRIMGLRVPRHFSSIVPLLPSSTTTTTRRRKIKFLFFYLTIVFYFVFSRGAASNTWWDTRQCYCYQFPSGDGRRRRTRRKTKTTRAHEWNMKRWNQLRTLCGGDGPKKMVSRERENSITNTTQVWTGSPTHIHTHTNVQVDFI